MDLSSQNFQSLISLCLGIDIGLCGCERAQEGLVGCRLLAAEIAWESYYRMIGRWPFEGVCAGKNLACYTDVAAYQWFALVMIIVMSR